MARPETARLSPWQVAVEFAGALAGSVVYLYAAGGLVMWARLRAVDLPADSIVAALPGEFLLTMGLTALVLPVAALALITAAIAWLWPGTESRRANRIFALLAVLLAAGVTIEGDPGASEVVFAVVGIAVLGGISLLRHAPSLPPDASLRAKMGSALRTGWPAGLLALYAALFLSENPLLLLVAAIVLVAVLPLSSWVGAAHTARGMAARVLLIAAVLGLVFRVSTELDPPSPFSPAVLYATDTATCSTREDPVAAPAATVPTCLVAGYVVAEADDSLYVAEGTGATTLRDLRIEAELSGVVAQIPRDAVKEVRFHQVVQVKRRGEEGDLAPFEQLLGPDEEPAEAETPAASPSSTTALVQRYAPLVWLHAKDELRPMSPDRFIARSALKSRSGGRDHLLAPQGSVRAARLGERCDGDAEGCYRRGGFSARGLTRPHHEAKERPSALGLKDGFHLDVDDKVRIGDTGLPVRAPIVYEIEGREELRITYWFFYGYSRPEVRFLKRNLGKFVSHEGDWENIDVVLSPDLRPKRVDFYGHGKPVRKEWSSICKIVGSREDCASGAAGHPVVYSAKGTHACYPNPNDSKNDDSRVCARKRIAGIRLCSYDFRNRGRIWKTWAAPIADARVQPWYGYGGAWGVATGSKDTTGPLGPSKFKRQFDLQAGALSSLSAKAPE